MDKEFQDRFGNIIKLTDKRWNHIINQHPEVEAYKKRFGEALNNPDLVKKSRRDKDTFFILPLLQRHISR